MSDKPEALRLADAVDLLWINGMAPEVAAELRRLHAEVEALRSERDRLVEDRARFPDRPDDIGRMIGARLGSLKSAAESNERFWRAAQAKAEILAAEVEALRADALRYRWLADRCRRTPEHWGGRWSIIIDGPCPKEGPGPDVVGAAIDAAMAKEQPK